MVHVASFETAAADPGRVRPLRLVIAIQGTSYLITGLWPVVDFGSFVSLAGPKPDRYQFFATVLLVLAIGLALLIGSLPVRRPDPVGRGLYTLAIATPLAFILIYLWVVAQHEQLPGVYLVDLAFELVLLGLVVWAGLKSRSRRQIGASGGRHGRSVDR